MMMRRCFCIMVLALVWAGGSRGLEFSAPSKVDFQKQWYDAGAEISRYHLSQSRYGENHEGNAVLIYVTEPFNPKDQVKADQPEPSSVPALKLNATRSFTTGLYSYSVMTSVFSAIGRVSHPLPLKVAFSSQEWCGQMYLQMNLENNTYRTASHSYFETEGDREGRVAKAYLEDGIWTMIRLAPERLPLGDTVMIPSAFYLSLYHREVKPYPVHASLTGFSGQSRQGSPLALYTLNYPTEKRVLKIIFAVNFPYCIERWEEVRLQAGGTPPLITQAVLTHTLMIDYWNKNHNQDRILLPRLGLVGTR